MEAVLFTLYVFAVIFVVLIALLAAWSDISGMVIDNVYPILIAAAFAVGYGALVAAGKDGAAFGALWQHLASGGAVLILTMGLFALGALGAGDSKLAAACALWAAAPGGLLPFFLATSLAGGALALATLVLRGWKPFSSPDPGGWIGRAQAGEGAVPYGAAIAVGLLATMVQAGCFDLPAIGAVDPSRL
jgi:prepilin peptidase CpaA